MSSGGDAGASEVPKLPATAWAVLGLLSFRTEGTGYDLKQWADTSLRFFYWSPATSQIYGELRRLEQLGYVTERTASQDELRNKRVYRITSAGTEALRTWVRDAPVEPPVLKHGVLLRVWLGHLSDPAGLRDTVRQHRAYAQSMIDDLRVSQAVASSAPEWRYPEIVTRWGVSYYEAERDLADELLVALDELEARGDADAPDRTPNPP